MKKAVESHAKRYTISYQQALQELVEEEILFQCINKH